MPCTDGRDRMYEDPETRRRLDSVTDMLCSTLKTLSYDQLKKLPARTREWWVDHQEEDARRERREAAAVQKQIERKKILAKLTATERALLGL